MDLIRAWNSMHFPSVVMFTSLVIKMVTCGNDRPVIGVLAQASLDRIKKYGQEYVMSEYVKFLEMAGASVVIIKGNQTEHHYEHIFQRINGILLPGGDVHLVTSPYARTSRIFYRLALEANDKGDHFPIWGTCLGFQMLTMLATDKNLLKPSDTENISLPLDLTPEYKESRLLGNAPKEIVFYLKNESITANSHHYCVRIEDFKIEEGLYKFYRLISTNKDPEGVEFVSTMEAFDYPFYGVQWHPEKNPFTMRTDQDISHSPHAVLVAQYLANFLVNEARKSNHEFSSEEERSRAVVENDDLVFVPEHYIEEYFYNITKN